MYAIRSYYVVEGRPLILGGVNVPYDLGLLGHSDADVLLHAVADAILGALGVGDIGRRITSYNVCYTKLLRGFGLGLCGPGPRHRHVYPPESRRGRSGRFSWLLQQL